ncbi:MAG TPA: cation:proton antiporter, partial [Flavisolibacter sp.]
WRMRKNIVGLGGLQVLATASVITVIAMSIGITWQKSLALGMILSLSSTAIVLQTMNEKNLMKTASGQGSFSVLLFQDIAVIPMLALFPLLATLSPAGDSENVHGHTSWTGELPAYLQAVFVLSSVALIIIAGRFLIRPLLRIVAATRLREVFTATALLLVIAISVLMTQVGLSPALGAFLAGVVLANSEYKHELESDIDPFKGLLLGLFFIAVGASIDFKLITEEPLMIFGLVLGLMALKGLVLWLLGKLFRLKQDQNLVFSFALSQVGEFAFVLFSFSLQKGILSQSEVNTMVAVVAISMAMTPLVMLLNEKWIQPNLVKARPDEQKEADIINENNPVIVAGFGHFGNTTGRFLRAHHIGMTILDNNAERVELLRRMGFKVYYGDASRYDLLKAAGADKARLIIITIEPAAKRMELIETIKKHFPNLHMFVRAQNRYDAYDQMNAGMLHVYRETLDSSLRMGVDAMRFLGHRNYSAQRAARNFLKLDEANLKKLASITDSEEYIISAKDKIEELERILQQDTNQFAGAVDKGWDEESLINDAINKTGSNE